MADEKPKMVKVEALQAHTFNGQSYEVGDSYDIDEQYIESVAVQGKAVRVDRVAVAKKANADAKKTEAARAKPAKGTAVKPMSMDAAPAVKPGKAAKPAKALKPAKPAKSKK